MALPKIATPFHEMELPSTGETIKYRPFLVKEEKLLLMAMEGNSQVEIANVMKQIITNCTDNKVDVENLPMFDVEYLFLQLRIKSVDDIAEVMLSCKKCNETNKSKINLKDIKVNLPEEKQDFKLQLNSDIGIVMKYPTLSVMSDMKGGEQENTETIFKTIIKCIDYIYDEKQVYKNFTEEELNEFIDSLPQEQFKKISEFFENMPKLEHTVKFTCPKCKTKNSFKLTGLQDFFDSASPTTV